MTESATFPVVFFDGDQEADVGAVAVHPSLEFKKFQAMIAHKIGVAPHQISLSLVRRKKARPSPAIRRKEPIDEASDFAAIARERDCFVLAVLRRSRRDRRGRGRRGAAAAAVPDNKAAIGPPMILRRNQEFPIGIWDYEAQIRNLERQKERYLMTTAAAQYYPFPAATAAAGGDLWRKPAVATVEPGVTCEECEAAKEEKRAAGFHRCVYDAVTVGFFRSPAGPIERPAKKPTEASL